jgi:hypothetical protein
MSQTVILLIMSDNGCMKLIDLLTKPSIGYLLEISQIWNPKEKYLLKKEVKLVKIINLNILFLAKHYNIPFLEASAKVAINVDETFTTMSKEILDRLQKQPQPQSSKNSSLKKGKNINEESKTK